MVPVQPGGYDGPVCPGYLAELGIAREAQMACNAHRNGDLALFFPDQAAPVLIAAMELDAAWNRFEAEQLEPKDSM